MTEVALTQFNGLKSLLFSIAYQMLGSVMDAEDMVQETFIRWQKCEREAVGSPKAWLSTVIPGLHQSFEVGPCAEGDLLRTVAA